MAGADEQRERFEQDQPACDVLRPRVGGRPAERDVDVTPAQRRDDRSALGVGGGLHVDVGVVDCGPAHQAQWGEATRRPDAHRSVV